MARFASIRRLVAKGVGVAAVIVLLGMTVLAGGLGGQAAHAAAARQSIYTQLSGTWLGHGLGDYGSCGAMYGELTFLSNQEYAYTQNSDNCAAFTLVGYYQVQHGILTMHWVRCTFACLPGTDSARISFISANVLQIRYAGRTFLYYRQ